jgi:hypothetical protein
MSALVRRIKNVRAYLKSNITVTNLNMIKDTFVCTTINVDMDIRPHEKHMMLQYIFLNTFIEF